jgi:hypothetical protein
VSLCGFFSKIHKNTTPTTYALGVIEHLHSTLVDQYVVKMKRFWSDWGINLFYRKRFEYGKD